MHNNYSRPSPTSPKRAMSAGSSESEHYIKPSTSHNKGKMAARSKPRKPTPASRGKIELVHVEDLQDEWQRPTKKQKVMRHFKRYWMCYAIAIVVLLAVGLPLLFLVILPAIAQLIVNKTDLPIYDATLKALSNDQVVVGLSTSLEVPAGLTVKLDALELYLHNKETPEFSPWTMVAMDSLKVKGKTNITVNEATVNVGNRSELHTWLTKMVYQKECDISVKGNTTARLGALHFNVKLEKTVTVKALDTLRGFSLDDTRIILPADEDGTNLIGNLTLPNWSDIIIGLGNLTFNAMAGDLVLGTASVFDVVLQTGNNSLPFRGELFLDKIMDNIFSILGSQGNAITEGELEILVSGNKTTVDGEHISYLENVLNDARIVSRIPILQLLIDAMSSLRDGDLTMDGLDDAMGLNIGGILDAFLGSAGVDGTDGEGLGMDIGGIVDELMGDEETGDRGILGELLDKLEMQNIKAKRRFVEEMIRTRKK